MTDSSNPVIDAVLHALRLLGATDREHAAEILTVAGTHLTDRERGQVLNQIVGDMHGHMPDREVAEGHQDGTAWFAFSSTDGTAQCGEPGCGVRLVWAKHPDRDQYGWREVTR